MLTLWDLKPLHTAHIREVKSHAETQRLYTLGLLPQAQITCLQNTAFNGPKVYQVSDQVLSLSQEIAELILIEPTEDKDDPRS